MPDWSGGKAHGGAAETNETTQEEPIPDMTGGKADGGDATAEETKKAAETADAAHATANEETVAPTSD